MYVYSTYQIEYGYPHESGSCIEFGLLSLIYELHFISGLKTLSVHPAVIGYLIRKNDWGRSGGERRGDVHHDSHAES